MVGRAEARSGAVVRGSVAAPALVLDGVSHRYRRPGAAEHVRVLRGVDLAVASGELVAVTGRSGSGKSTLLHLAGALAVPDAGTITVAGRSLGGLSAGALAAVRRRTVGFVFQAFHLLAGLSLAENVALPLVLDGEDRRTSRVRAEAALEAVGLAGLGDRRPAELSGGQQQRGAVARALVTEPALLLADEPTGNLDDETAADVFAALVAAVRDRGTACVVVTHDLSVAAATDRAFTLADGVLHQR